MMAAIAPSLTASPDNRVSFPPKVSMSGEECSPVRLPLSIRQEFFPLKFSWKTFFMFHRLTEKQSLAKGNARTMIHLDQWFSNWSVLIKPQMAYYNTDLWAPPQKVLVQ